MQLEEPIFVVSNTFARTSCGACLPPSKSAMLSTTVKIVDKRTVLCSFCLRSRDTFQNSRAVWALTPSSMSHRALATCSGPKDPSATSFHSVLSAFGALLAICFSSLHLLPKVNHISLRIINLRGMLANISGNRLLTSTWADLHARSTSSSLFLVSLARRSLSSSAHGVHIFQSLYCRPSSMSQALSLL